MPASTGVDRLYDAIEGDQDKRGHKLYNATEANFLNVLRGCSNAEVNYFNSKNFSSNVLIEMADMTEANRSYEANLQVVKQARDLISMTIDLMRNQS